MTPFFSVFTPTYNRADLLPRVYASLCRQPGVEFEWLVIDDGSSDNTREVVAGWVDEADFPIRYIYQDNQGKHGAYRTALDAAQGFALVTIDSDDELAEGALATMRAAWEALPESNRDGLVGVCGLFATPDGKTVGQSFPVSPYISNSIDLRFRHGIHGDKIGFNRIDVLKRFPFPRDLGKFVKESTVWNRISQEYDTAFINDVIGVKEYQPGGLSDNARINNIESPVANVVYFLELVQGRRPLTALARLRCWTMHIRYSWHAGKLPSSPHSLLDVPFWLCALPLSVLLYLRDRVLVAQRTPG